MKKLTPKRKRYLKIHSLKCLKQKARRNKSFRQEKVKGNIGISRHPKQNYRRPRHRKPQPRYLKPKEKIFRPPLNFSLISNTEAVLKFIYDFKGVKGYANAVDVIVLDMSKITKIDIGAINLLLSAQYDISFYDIKFIGVLPTELEPRSLFHDSGYLTHMKKIGGGSFASNEKHDLILKLGREHTRNESVGKLINEAMDFLTGVKDHYSPVYSAIMEMAPNSIEHAYLENKHWILGMHCEEETKKVSFTFTDNGSGIIKTLNRKYTAEIRDRFLGKNVQVIIEAFNKKFGSRTEEINRNKGLPMIKKIFNQGKIKNLILITDNVFFDFKNNNGSLLNTKFAGTFYYWELDLSCIENGKSNKTV